MLWGLVATVWAVSLKDAYLDLSDLIEGIFPETSVVRKGLLKLLIAYWFGGLSIDV